MLEVLGEQIRSCYERAAEAREKAEQTADAALKADFLGVEQRWLSLARSYEFTNRLEDFTAAMPPALQLGPSKQAGPRFDEVLWLQEISTALIREGDAHGVYERVLDAAVAMMSADMGSMQVLCPDRGELKLLGWRGFHPESAAFWQWVRLGSGSTCGQALSSGVRVVVPDVEACDFMAGTADLDSCRRSAIRAVQSTPLVSRSGRLLGMISTHWREPHRPAERALLLLDVLSRQAADLVERNQTEAALRESEQRSRRLASVVEFSADAIISKDLNGIITSWNMGAERVFGYSADEAVGQSLTMLVPPDRPNEEPTILERIRRGERIDHYETVRQRKDGSLITVSLSISPVKDEQGKIVGGSKIARDITERKRNEDLIAALAREAEHRTKNVLATVQAVVQFSQANTPSGLKQRIQARIQALAKAHTLFAQSRWAGADLSTLAAQELAPYHQDDGARVRIDGPQLLLAPIVAQAIAMTLHELTTNAAKYGALSVAQGHVKVTWSLASDGRLVLHWSEMGGPPVVTPRRQGFGTQVIRQMITGQLNGTVGYDWRADGLVCEIAFPFSDESDHELRQLP